MVTIKSIDKTYLVASHSVRGAIDRAVFQSYLNGVNGLRRNYKVRYGSKEEMEQFRKDYPYANVSNQYELF